MQLTYQRIKEFLSKEQREMFIKKALKDDEWIVHKSSKSGKISPLHFKKTPYIFYERHALFMMMPPNSIQDWHTDMRGRNCVLIYPLTENYAPCEIGDSRIDFPAIINTQIKHRVINNDCVRINLQIPFEENIEDVIEILKNEIE